MPNVRRTVIDDSEFQKLHSASEEWLKPVVLVAFDTGMREREILALLWEQVNLKDGVITGMPWEDIRRVFRRACEEAKIEGPTG